MMFGTRAVGASGKPLLDRPRRPRRPAVSLLGFSFACVASSALFSSPALADSPCAGSVSACLNSDTFWPAPGPTRFVGVASTQTVTEGELAVGLVTSYQSRPVVLRSASPGPSGAGTETFAVDNQVTTNFLWQYGITRQLAFDAALPITLGQGGAGLSALTGGDALKSTAVRDLRFGLALALVPRERVDAATSRQLGGEGHAYSVTLRLGMTAPIGDKVNLAGERTAVFTPSLAGDYRFGRVSLGVEVGARVRPTSDLLGSRIGTQLAGGLGVGVDLLPRELLTVQAEARALYNFPEQADVSRVAGGGLVSTPNGRHIVPAEWMLSARTAPLPWGDLSFLLGGGGGLVSDTVTVPRFRFVFGVVYAPEGRDSDGDGISDRLDRCPHVSQRGEPRDGCDHSREPQTAEEPRP